MIEVEAPDGSIIEFPDGTDDQTIDRVMRENFAPQPEKTGFQVLDRPLSETLSQTATAPDDRPNMAQRVMRSINDRLHRFNRSFTNAYMLGAVDEIEGGADALMTDKSYGEAVANARAQANADAQRRPIISAIGAGLGGVSQGANIARGLGLPLPSSLGGQMAQGAGIGAIEGGIYGFNDGEGLGRLPGAAKGALFGAGVGGAAPAVISGTRAGFDAMFGAPIASMRPAASQTRASAAVQTAIKRSGKTPQQLKKEITDALAAGQTGYGLADAMGNSGQRMLAGAARTPGDSRQEIVDFLTRRQGEQARRIGGAVDDALNAPRNPGGMRVAGQRAPGDFSGMTADQARNALVAQRSTQAGNLYRQARDGAGPVDVRGVIAELDNRLGPMVGVDIEGDGIDATFSRIRKRLAADRLPEGVDSIELSDFNRVLGVKQDVQDMIGKAVRAGENNRVRELSGIVDRLDEALEASSGGYRAANDSFRKASRIIDQIDAGAAATRPRARTGNVQAAYANLTPEQQAAFRVGYSDPVLARIEGAAPGVNKARPLLDDASQAELGMMARDRQELLDFLRREDDMFRTGQAAMGGSMTADNMADQTDIASQGASILGNLLSGRIGAAASQGAQAALNAAQGRNTATRDLIARLLMSGDVDAALAPALAAQAKGVNQSAILEALMRTTERSLGGR